MKTLRAARGAPLVGLALLLGGPLAAQDPMNPPAPDPALSQAVAQLRSGQYDEALSALRQLARGSDAPVQARRAYARALMEVGRYDEAREAVSGPGGRAASAELENVLGEALYAEGKLEEAEGAFRRSVEGGARDLQTARKNLGILEWNRGERDAALALFDSFIDLYNRSGGGLSAEDLMAVGTAVRYLGVTNPALYQDALMAFDDAAAADPRDPRPELLTGELFLEKYRATDARESFRKVLEENPDHPRALLGQARILDFEGVGGAVELARRALEVNPRYADAMAFLASVFLKTEDFGRAREEASRALDVNPVHLEALSILAAAHFLAGDTTGYRQALARIHAVNPVYPGVYTIVAEQAVAQRQYQAAVDLASQAVGVDSTSWWSYGVLGLNQLRTGAVEAGRANLEIAFAGDPYNPWYKNTLDLLDTFFHYKEIRTDHFEIFIHEREADLLGPYASAMAEEAYTALQARYGVEPPTPVRLEIYPSHADFSVRTLGMTGLGALGVSFGSTLVMDSPSAQDPGEFNWASTMWHEISHAFHLAMTDHRVPRWFTEGLAVHEQREARSWWGFRATPAWLQAYQDGRLPPVSGLNEGFIRPQFPEQVVFSYFEASLVFDLIETRWGLPSVLAMLQGYRDGKTNEDVFEEVLGQDPEAFDRTFDSYVQTRFGERMEAVTPPEEAGGSSIFHSQGADLDGLRMMAVENPGNFLIRLSLGKALVERGRLDEAEEELRAALRLFPEYGGPDSPYQYLAEIHRQRGEPELAARALQQLGELTEAGDSIRREEAELWLEAGDRSSATQALEQVVQIAPFDLESHRELAELYGEGGRPGEPCWSGGRFWRWIRWTRPTLIIGWLWPSGMRGSGTKRGARS